MELQIRVVGWMLIPLALLHIIFPRYFNWTRELSTLSLVNRQMVYVHTFFIALVLLLMGLLCVRSSRELVDTPLGHQIALGFGIFWILRLCIQFFGFSPHIWRGKKFETGVHIAFSVLWLYLSTVFFWVYWMGKGA